MLSGNRKLIFRDLSMLIQSDYHIHAAFYRMKKEGDIPGIEEYMLEITVDFHNF